MNQPIPPPAHNVQCCRCVANLDMLTTPARLQATIGTHLVCPYSYERIDAIVHDSMAWPEGTALKELSFSTGLPGRFLPAIGFRTSTTMMLSSRASPPRTHRVSHGLSVISVTLEGVESVGRESCSPNIPKVT